MKSIRSEDIPSLDSRGRESHPRDVQYESHVRPAQDDSESNWCFDQQDGAEITQTVDCKDREGCAEQAERERCTGWAVA